MRCLSWKIRGFYQNRGQKNGIPGAFPCLEKSFAQKWSTSKIHSWNTPKFGPKKTCRIRPGIPSLPNLCPILPLLILHVTCKLLAGPWSCIQPLTNSSRSMTPFSSASINKNKPQTSSVEMPKDSMKLPNLGKGDFWSFSHQCDLRFFFGHFWGGLHLEGFFPQQQ